MQQDADAKVRRVRCGSRSRNLTPSAMANPPLVIMASVPPSHTATIAWDFRASAAAEICPGSPHSVKNSEPKQAMAARDQETLAAGGEAGVSGSSNQITMAETKNAQALSKSVQLELSRTTKLPSRTAANILLANAKASPTNTTGGRKRRASELTV